MTVQPSMQHLLDETQRELPLGFDLLTTQRSLQMRMWETGMCDYEPHTAAVTHWDLLQCLRANDEAIDSEREEIRDRLNWKAWKKDHRAGREAALTEDELFEIKFELIDELHFLANKLIKAGFTSWNEVERWYLAKNRENIDRQEKGY